MTTPRRSPASVTLTCLLATYLMPLALWANISVHLTKSALDVSGATLYAYSDTGTYLNQNRVTDATGHATFTATDGQVMKFRYTSNGVYLWSAPATAPAAAEFAVPADTVVTVTKTGVPLTGLQVYAFSEAGVYLNYCLTTDATGTVRFSLADGQNVKFRVTNGSVYHWSGVATTPANVSFAVPADTVATITKAGLAVYAFDAAGTYLTTASPPMPRAWCASRSPKDCRPSFASPTAASTTGPPW